MKKLLLISILIGILLLSGCVEKECKTDSDCSSRDCFELECKNNKCVYSVIANCCGNEVCEVGETYEDCVVDCPDCDDVNECTKDSYDYHEQKCVNKPILDVICCGNGLCEIGETYENCTRDCPDCDDKSDCTVDSYDYHKQECANEIITPCCGNNICDEGAETLSDCPEDCPDCDDNKKITEDIFSYATQKCGYITYSFFDDFEEGHLDEWYIWRANPEDDWEVISENGNKIARGYGETDLHRGSKDWVDYTFMWKLKLINQGGAGVWVRENDGGRYEFGIHKNKISIQVLEYNGDSTFLTDENLDLPLNKWHDFKIIVKGSNLKFYLNNKIIIDVDDEENTFPKGRIGVKSHTGSEVYFDDFKVRID